jgi:hypothetical protein
MTADERRAAIQTQIADAVADVLKARILGPGTGDATKARTRSARLPAQLIAQGSCASTSWKRCRRRSLLRRAAQLEPTIRVHWRLCRRDHFLAQDFLVLDFDRLAKERSGLRSRAQDRSPVRAGVAGEGVIDHIVAIRSSEQRYELSLAALRKAVEIDPNDSESLEMSRTG